MYADFFGFRELPFNNTPDPRFFFATPDHEEGLASLIYAVKERKGFVLLTGEVGTGKTLVTRMMLRHFGTQLSFANISHGIQTPVELMESICTEFELDFEPDANNTQLIRSLHDFLLAQFAQDIPVVLVLDEAQNLPVQAFEQLRMIGNLEADDAKLLQIAIVGQPELQRRFLSPKLRQLRQRIFRSYHLPALSSEVTAQYIRHRLSVVTDSEEEIFNADAVSEIFRISRGLPRIINTICDNALLSAYSIGQRRIDGPFVESVASQMMILDEYTPEQDHASLQSPSRGDLQAGCQQAGFASACRHTRERAPSGAVAEIKNSEFRIRNSESLINGASQPANAAPPDGDTHIHRDDPPHSKEAATDKAGLPTGNTSLLVAHATRAARNELTDLVVSLENYKREASSNAARIEHLVGAVAEERSKAQALHDSLAGMVQKVAHATDRAEAASRTLRQRDAQLGKVSMTISELVRNLRTLLDRVRETTGDVVTVERGARRTCGRLSAQVNSASRFVDELARLSNRIPPTGRPTSSVPIDSELTTPTTARPPKIQNSEFSPQVQPTCKQALPAPVAELLRNARASLRDLRSLANTGHPSDYVRPQDIGQKAESAKRLADQVEDILGMIEPASRLCQSDDAITPPKLAAAGRE